VTPREKKSVLLMVGCPTPLKLIGDGRMLPGRSPFDPLSFSHP
jgi:hypothetical protein